MRAFGVPQTGPGRVPACHRCHRLRELAAGDAGRIGRPWTLGPWQVRLADHLQRHGRGAWCEDHQRSEAPSVNL